MSKKVQTIEQVIVAVTGDTIRHGEDGSISMVWRDGEPVRCPTQEDMDTLPVGADMTEDEIELLD